MAKTHKSPTKTPKKMSQNTYGYAPVSKSHPLQTSNKKKKG